MRKLQTYGVIDAYTDAIQSAEKNESIVDKYLFAFP
jgi:hypothetical protein